MEKQMETTNSSLGFFLTHPCPPAQRVKRKEQLYTGENAKSLVEPTRREGFHHPIAFQGMQNTPWDTQGHGQSTTGNTHSLPSAESSGKG